MLTGDNERTAKAIGAQCGIDEVIAGVLPQGKADEIAKLCKFGIIEQNGRLILDEKVFLSNTL